METTIQEQEMLAKTSEVINLLAEGKFIEAMENYLADDVQLFEGNNPAKVGKEFCLAEEQKLLDTVTAFHGYQIISGPAVKGDTTFYEAVMEFDTNDGTKHRFEQVVRTQWKDGKIVNERYYHA
ncbi:SnoaL-like domain-containing protein [Flagellimonas onchidii]|uniref:SnoaL-like domain-containing protein n=1 Tax=Flagellimonas onchidii TaxID=2562684 RepID=UPI0010A5A9DC|nr:SnoaL-like domain-containing protein [Allomuricauda onchidii]